MTSTRKSERRPMTIRPFFRLAAATTAACLFAWSLSTTPAAAQTTLRDAAVATPSTDTTLWVAPNERILLGLGQRSAWPTFATPHADANVRTLGLGLHLSPSTALTWESDANALRSHQAWIDNDQHRVGLSFRSNHQAKDMRSLLTLQLSGQSALHLRPRGGGVRVSYRLNF